MIDLVLRHLLVAGAIASVTWCCYEYSRNEDMCEVSFKRFLEDNDRVYPDLTVWMPIQINETKLKEVLDSKWTTAVFQNILYGNHWDDRILDIQLSDLYLPLNEYMISHCIWSSFYQPCTKLQEIETRREFGALYHEFRLPTDKKTNVAAFQFSTEVFDNGVHPGPTELMVLFHYPNRLFRAQGSLFNLYWSPMNEGPKDRRITFKLKDMEVLRRRNKRGDECTETTDYDSKIKESVYQQVGCRPFYINKTSVQDICNTKEQMSEISKKLLSFFHRSSGGEIGIPPCTEVQRIQIEHVSEPSYYTTYDEINQNFQRHNKTNDTWFEIRYDIQTDTFKEIKQNRAYTTQSLIGNVGGYLGLLIGFSFIDIINAAKSFQAKFQKHCDNSISSTTSAA